MIGDAAVDVGAGEGVVAAVMMGGGRYMLNDARSYWTFAVMGELGIEQKMAIEVPICGRI